MDSLFDFFFSFTVFLFVLNGVCVCLSLASVSVARELTNIASVRLLVNIFNLVRHFFFMYNFFFKLIVGLFQPRNEPETAVVAALFGGWLAGC